MLNESSRGGIKRDDNQTYRTVTLKGAPFYPATAFSIWQGDETKTITIPDKPEYTVINSLGKRHECDYTRNEIYTHQQSEEDNTIFNYVSTVDPIKDCNECEKARAAHAERERIRKEEREFKESIKVEVELGDYGYNWSMAQVGKSPDGRLWIRYGSGCSCSSIDDEDWGPFTEAIQAKEASRHMGDNAIQRAEFIADAQELLSGNKA